MRPHARPPWWPETEPWPPQDAAAWRELRRGFMRRAGCFALVIALVLVVVVGAVIGVLATVTGASPAGVVGVIVALIVLS